MSSPDAVATLLRLANRKTPPTDGMYRVDYRLMAAAMLIIAIMTIAALEQTNLF